MTNFFKKLWCGVVGCKLTAGAWGWEPKPYYLKLCTRCWEWEKKNDHTP